MGAFAQKSSLNMNHFVKYYVDGRELNFGLQRVFDLEAHSFFLNNLSNSFSRIVRTVQKCQN